LGQANTAKFPIQNRLKQEDALWPLLFNFAFEIAIREVLVYEEGLKTNETHQHLVYADSFYLLGSNLNITNKTQALY
jgi:hypothetical protein